MSRVLLLITAFVCLFDTHAWARGSSASARGGSSTPSWMPFVLTQDPGGELGAPQVNALPESLQAYLRPNDSRMQSKDSKPETDSKTSKQTREQNLTRIKDLEAKKEDLWTRAKAKQNGSWACSLLGLSCRSIARDELDEIDRLSGELAVLRRDIDDSERETERVAFSWIADAVPCTQPQTIGSKTSDDYSLVVCLNTDQKLQSVHVIKASNEVLRSDIQRGSAGTIERVRITDVTEAILEEHEWTMGESGQPRYSLRFISSRGETVTVSAEQTR